MHIHNYANINYYTREPKVLRPGLAFRSVRRGAAAAFCCAFFSGPLGSLIKYFLGVDATAGHVPESVVATASRKVVPGMFKANERASATPEISCGQRFRRRHRGRGLKLRGPQDENVFESRKASPVLS